MFVLYNKELKRFLKHPKDGIWASEDIEEAQNMLQSAQEYVKVIGFPEIADYLTVMEISTDNI